MKSRLGLLLGVGAIIAIGCNSIVGVEDVKYKSTVPAKSSSSGSHPTSGDDDDTTTTTSGGTTFDAGPRDSGATKKQACAGAVDCERIVFVTSQTFTANLGGLTGADQKCVDAAKANPAISGIAFRAWMSDSTIDAKTRIPNGTKAFKRTDGTLMATGWADLTDGSLNLPLTLDESGKTITGASAFERGAWTGTNSSGIWDTQGDTCLDWNSESVTNSGSFGDSQATDVSWSDTTGETSSCNASKHLYCIEY